MTALLLEGEVDNRDRELDELRAQVQDLEADLEVARAEAKRATQQAARAMANLRRQLSPLYQALQMVFGELDAAGVAEPTTAAVQGDAAKWEAIKQKLAPRMREAIDLLLLQKTMKRTQLAAALKMDYSNCSKNVIGILIRQGWVIDGSNGLYLKEL
jgi:chromosome segregation ATPase